MLFTRSAVALAALYRRRAIELGILDAHEPCAGVSNGMGEPCASADLPHLDTWCGVCYPRLAGFQLLPDALREGQDS